MKKSHLFAVLVIVLGISASLNAQAKLPEGWKVFTVLDGKVSIALPAEPEIDTKAGYPTITAATTEGVVVFARQTDVGISEKNSEDDLLTFSRGFREGIIEEIKVDTSGFFDA